MVGAGAARLGQALLQRFTCPEHSHAGVAGRQAALLGEHLDRCAVHVDGLQRFRVFGLQRPRQTADAGADFGFYLRLGYGPALELACKGLDRPARRAAPTELIDGGVAKRSIEPGDHAFVGRRLPGPVHHLRERVLQNVFRERAIADPALQVRQERPMVVEQDGDRRRRVVLDRFSRAHPFSIEGDLRRPARATAMTVQTAAAKADP